MPLKLQELEEPTLNLTPMIDIVLLLVIFFMVGTQFTDAERQYDIALPTVTEARPLTGAPDELVVNVASSGMIFLGKTAVTLQDLEKRLTEARERYAGQAVVVRGDRELTYQTVMTLLNICQKAGIANIQLANRLEKNSQ